MFINTIEQSASYNYTTACRSKQIIINDLFTRYDRIFLAVLRNDQGPSIFMQHFSLSDFPYITVTAISIKTLKITKKIFSDKNFSQQMDV